MAPSTFNKCKEKCDIEEKRDLNCHVFGDSRWAFLPFFLLASGFV
jgi:hypothetical protein